MNLIKLILLISLGVTSSCFGELDVASLEQRNEQDTSSVAGKAFEKDAVRAFWGNVIFMRECAPPEFPVADSLTIYFEVRTDGSLGGILILPDTTAGRCIAKAVSGRQFPIPTEDFVAKVDLKFQE